MPCCICSRYLIPRACTKTAVFAPSGIRPRVQRSTRSDAFDRSVAMRILSNIFRSFVPSARRRTSFHLARISSLEKKPTCRKTSLPVASKKICVGIVSTPYLSAWLGCFQTSMNSTSKTPAYSAFSSSRMGAIILQGMHCPAPRSSNRGRPLTAFSEDDLRRRRAGRFFRRSAGETVVVCFTACGRFRTVRRLRSHGRRTAAGSQRGQQDHGEDPGCLGAVPPMWLVRFIVDLLLQGRIFSMRAVSFERYPSRIVG